MEARPGTALLCKLEVYGGRPVAAIDGLRGCMHRLSSRQPAGQRQSVDRWYGEKARGQVRQEVRSAGPQGFRILRLDHTPQGRRDGPGHPGVTPKNPRHRVQGRP